MTKSQHLLNVLRGLLDLCREGTWMDTSLTRHCEGCSLQDWVGTPVNFTFMVFLAVRSTPRAQRMCLVAFLDVRNAILSCLHFRCTNNRIIISFLRVQINSFLHELEYENLCLFPEKRGVYELIGCTNYWKFYGNLKQFADTDNQSSITTV